LGRWHFTSPCIWRCSTAWGRISPLPSHEGVSICDGRSIDTIARSCTRSLRQPTLRHQ
jgi:hypothetical protein